MRNCVAITLCLAFLFSFAACNSEQQNLLQPQSPEQTEIQPIPSWEAPTMECSEATEVTEDPAPGILPETIPEPEPVAERISEGVKLLVNGRDCSYVLCDGNHYTKKQIDEDHALRVESETTFSALYLEWDRIPGKYSINWQGGSLECGENDFLHEYIRLPEAVNDVQFSFDDGEEHLICEIEVYTAGAAPAGVQDWLPPCEQADILVFPTHSDDDVLFFGPLVSYYAIESGLTVQMAFMVNHAHHWERAHERLNGLWEMGIRHYPILGNARDTGHHDFAFGLNFYAEDDIPGWQVEQIRRFKPLVVLGHDLNGEYGNAGHKVNAYYLTQSIVAAADPEQYPESAAAYGVWDTPKLYLHLYTENTWYFDVNTPMMNDPEGRTPFEVAEDALKWHVSQIQEGLRVYQRDSAYSWDCRPFGLYRSLVGEDTTADVMEHIDPEDWR